MNSKTSLILLCIATIFFLPVPLLAGADRSATGGGKGVVVEREKRFMQWALDDVAASRKLAEEDITELERQKAAVTPLEPSRREEDLSNLLDWYYRYYDLLMGEEDAADSDLARLSAPGAVTEMQVGRFGEMADKGTELARELKEKVKEYEADRKRLAAILDHRRLLQAQFSDLEAQLARLGRREPEQSRPPSEREKGEEKRLQADIRVVQTELLSLPDIDEDILKHFTVLIEHGRWEGEWLALTVEEYDALQEVASLLAARDIGATAQAYQRLIRTYNGEIGRLTRMSDELDRKRSRLSPAGTMREMDRTRDLINLYDRLQQRFDGRINELKIHIGACEAELAELRSLQ